MRNSKVHILGGGFSGLMAAYFCRQQGHDVVVSEAKRWGGMISTRKTEFGLVESAANGFLLTEQLERVATEIGIPLVKPLKGARKRWIANEKPERLPVSPLTLAGTAFRFFANKRSHRHVPMRGELLSDWGDRVLGEKFQSRLILPAVQGIYGADSRRLSASLVLQPFFSGGRAKRKGLASPREGMGQWTDLLLAKLRSMGVELREEAVSVLPDADHLILACGSDAKAKLLESRAPRTSRALAAIERLDMVSVTAFFEPDESDRKGFGVLFHPDHGWRASGVLFNDSIFEGRSPQRSEAWMFPDSKAKDLDESQWSNIITEERAKIGMSAKAPLKIHVTRWTRALPLYSPSLEAFLGEKTDLPEGLHLLGHEMGEIGLTGLAEKAEFLAKNLNVPRISSVPLRSAAAQAELLGVQR